MKTQITRTVLVTLILLLSITISGYAQTTYSDVYLCGNVTATLRPNVPAPTILANGDKVHWFLDGSPLIVKTYDGTDASIQITVPANLPVGEHKYTTIVETAAECMGDESEPFNIYKLPNKTLALTENRATYCAEESNAIKDATITATTTITPATPALPAGIEYAYTWSVTKDGNAVSPGTADNSNTSTSVYTMNTTTAGTYIFHAKVKYVLNAAAMANGSVLKAEDTEGCEVEQTSTTTVIVTPKPSKPTITLVN